MRFSLPSHSRTSFLSLSIGNPARNPKAPACVPFRSSWSTLRNITYLSGLRVSGFYPLDTLLTDTSCPRPFGSPAPWPYLCDFPHPSSSSFLWATIPSSRRIWSVPPLGGSDQGALAQDPPPWKAAPRYQESWASGTSLAAQEWALHSPRTRR